LLPEVQRKTGKRFALRTLQHYGKEELRIKSRPTKKRTADESKCTAAHRCEQRSITVEHVS
jgi:hypothetical protein